MTLNKAYQYWDAFSKDEPVIVYHSTYNSSYVMF